MKFKEGDEVVVIGDVIRYKAEVEEYYKNKRGVCTRIKPSYYDVEVYFPEFDETYLFYNKELELSSVYDSPLYKALL